MTCCTWGLSRGVRKCGVEPWCAQVWGWGLFGSKVPGTCLFASVGRGPGSQFSRMLWTILKTARVCASVGLGVCTPLWFNCATRWCVSCRFFSAPHFRTQWGAGASDPFVGGEGGGLALTQRSGCGAALLLVMDFKAWSSVGAYVCMYVCV